MRDTPTIRHPLNSNGANHQLLSKSVFSSEPTNDTQCCIAVFIDEY